MFRTIKSVRIPNRNTIRYLSVKSITFAEKGTQEYKIRNVYIQKGQIVGVNDPIADFLSPVDILELKASFRGEIVDVHCKVGDGVHYGAKIYDIQVDKDAAGGQERRAVPTWSLTILGTFLLIAGMFGGILWYGGKEGVIEKLETHGESLQRRKEEIGSIFTDIEKKRIVPPATSWRDWVKKLAIWVGVIVLSSLFVAWRYQNFL